jgi:methylated-DNA-[protein]-cysteine S-methyltransferase
MAEDPRHDRRFCLVETTLGWVGIAWSARGITHLQLPERDKAATRHRLLQRTGTARESAAEGHAAVAAEAIGRLARGEPVDLRDLPLDLTGIDAFRAGIYAEARKIGFGETTTYGALAAAAGHPGKARETGEAMGSNPAPLIVPCHRVLAANGKLGGFSAPGGTDTKRRLLAIERAQPPSPPDQSAFAF